MDQLFQFEQFQNKTMPKVYIYAFVVSLVPMYFYMRDRYHEDKQLKHIMLNMLKILQVYRI